MTREPFWVRVHAEAAAAARYEAIAALDELCSEIGDFVDARGNVVALVSLAQLREWNSTIAKALGLLEAAEAE